MCEDVKGDQCKDGASSRQTRDWTNRICKNADWMETDSRVICPDPACKLIMRIDRVGERLLNHDDVSPIKWEGGGGDKGRRR